MEAEQRADMLMIDIYYLLSRSIIQNIFSNHLDAECVSSRKGYLLVLEKEHQMAFREFFYIE